MKYQFEYWEPIKMCSDCPSYSHNELEFCRIADECVDPYAKPDWCPLVEVKEN